MVKTWSSRTYEAARLELQQDHLAGTFVGIVFEFDSHIDAVVAHILFAADLSRQSYGGNDFAHNARSCSRCRARLRSGEYVEDPGIWGMLVAIAHRRNSSF